MSKTHYVNCTINNTTTSDIVYTAGSGSYDLSHGQFFSGPSSVDGGQVIQTFSAGSKQDLNGINGWVMYSLDDGSSLYLMFNNPYTHQGTGYTGNQWLYACLSQYSKYSVTVDSSTFIDPVNPMSSDTIAPIVNVYVTADMVPNNIPTQSFSSPVNNYVYLNILNNTGYPLSLQSMTNDYDSPPINYGNPPYVAETIPVTSGTTSFLAVFADGGGYSGEDVETQGIVNYNLPDGSILEITWQSDDSNTVTINLGGTGESKASYSIDEEDSSNVTITINS